MYGDVMRAGEGGIYSRLCLKRTPMGPTDLSTKDRGPLKTESVV